jgi:hypothetical protein
MNLFLVLTLRETDDRNALVESLVDLLTQSKYLHPNEKLSFNVVGDTLLVYRSHPVLYGTPGKPLWEAIGGD